MAANNYNSFERLSTGSIFSEKAHKPISMDSSSSNKWTKFANIAWIAMMFVAWWTLSALYNIYNKLAVNTTPAPLSIATIQFAIGWLWFVPLWIFGIRDKPRFYSSKLLFTKIFPQGAFHSLSHLGGTASMGAGAVFFMHVIKSAEPVFTAFFSAIILRHIFSVWTYMTLAPIVGGVCMASFAELGFNWYSFFTAILANLGSSLRAVYAKSTMAEPKKIGVNLTAANLYAVLTIIATLLCIPVALVFEGGSLYSKWGSGVPDGEDIPSSLIARWIVLSGICYYAYNEVAFHVLSRVDQVSHAVGNTMKRIFIIFGSVMFFDNRFTVTSAVGSLVAIAGTFLFSLSKQKFG